MKAGLIEDRRPTLSIHLAGSRGWRTTDAWPILEAVHHAYALRADEGLGEDEGEAGSRAYMNLALVSIAHVRVRPTRGSGMGNIPAFMVMTPVHATEKPISQLSRTLVFLRKNRQRPKAAPSAANPVSISLALKIQGYGEQ